MSEHTKVLEPTTMAPGPDHPRAPSLERRVDGQLWITVDGKQAPVHAYRCFPWSEPLRFVSLRDPDEEEWALVHDLSDLDSGSREVLEQALAEAGFILQVTEILGVDEEVEIRSWRVGTRQGHRTFQTRLDDWPRELHAGGYLIRDVGGDLYHVADPESLDSRSRKLLWAYVE